jgi:type II secretory pathway pseudopilin PulG
MESNHNLKARANATLIIFVLVIIATVGYLLYSNFQTNQQSSDTRDSTVEQGRNIYEGMTEDEILRQSIEESNRKLAEQQALEQNPPTTGNAILSGRVCFPSSFIPKGEIAIKNTGTNDIKYVEINENQSTFTAEVEPGTYNLRFQAHANVSNPDQFTSGYYTKCGASPQFEVCNAADAHDLIDLEAKPGQKIEDVDVCDFYYDIEPAF